MSFCQNRREKLENFDTLRQICLSTVSFASVYMYVDALNDFNGSTWFSKQYLENLLPNLLHQQMRWTEMLAIRVIFFT